MEFIGFVITILIIALSISDIYGIIEDIRVKRVRKKQMMKRKKSLENPWDFSISSDDITQNSIENAKND